MLKIDHKKQFKDLYNPSSKQVSVVDVPAMNFLMIDGHGDPNSAPVYAEAVQALYAVAYTLKFKVKKGQGIDYAVMPLEGLWWVPDMRDFSDQDKSAWDWTMMIMQPEYITSSLVAEATGEAAKKKDLPALPKLRFEIFTEGPSAQLMHIGPYAAEAENIQRVHAFIQANGHSLHQKHHEIYLSDPRKSAPEKMKTIIRQPFR
jgi:hypothetical protein